MSKRIRRMRGGRRVVITALAVVLAACPGEAPDGAGAAPDPLSGPTDAPPGSQAAGQANPGTEAGSAPAPSTAGTASGSGRVSGAATASPAGSVLTSQGWGPLRIGMTRAEVVAAAGEDANPEAVGGPDPEQCDEFRPEQAPQGLRVMVEQGRLTRISAGSSSSVSTDRGFRVGDDAARVVAAYGDEAEISAHKYVAAPAQYITVWTSPPDSEEPRGIVYEMGPDGRVSQIHVGGPSILYVEGCL